MQANTLFERMLDDSKWSDGTEMATLADEYWKARHTGDDEKFLEIDTKMDECKPIRQKRETVYGGTLYQITRPDNSGNFALTDEWDQLETPQDAWYFGLWANKSKQWIYTYAEGDICLEVYPDKSPDEFAEIAKLSQKWYFVQCTDLATNRTRCTKRW